MTEFFQKIVFFIEPADKACDIPAKIGKLFLNRFGIDEDANSEILKVYHLDHILLDDVESLKLTLDVIDMGRLNSEKLNFFLRIFFVVQIGYSIQ